MNMKNKFLTVLSILLLLVSPVTANQPATFKESNPLSNVTINDFWVENCTGVAPFGVNFNSNVTGEVSGWCWVFEPVGKDYYSQHANTAKHTFSKPGIYNVTLQVWDEQGNVTQLTKVSYINVSAKPKVPCVPAKDKKFEKVVSFTGKHETCKTVSEFLWNFGDGKTAVSKTLGIKHTYTKKGKYTAIVTVKYTDKTTKKVCFCVKV